MTRIGLSQPDAVSSAQYSSEQGVSRGWLQVPLVALVSRLFCSPPLHSLTLSLSPVTVHTHAVAKSGLAEVTAQRSGLHPRNDIWQRHWKSTATNKHTASATTQTVKYFCSNSMFFFYYPFNTMSYGYTLYMTD